MMQLSLFKEEEIPQPQKPKGKNGGSGNPIVFHDYESFVAKFTDNPKTTDDCFTPQDVYEAVVKYVGTVVDKCAWHLWLIKNDGTQMFIQSFETEKQANKRRDFLNGWHEGTYIVKPSDIKIE